MVMKRILVVDDDLEFIEILRILLEARGYEVRTALDGLEALAALSSTVEPEPDIVVADVTMPNCNGLELCRQVRQWSGFELLPFIFLSARAMPQDRVAGLLVGADDYLTKPFETEELILRIEKRVQRRQLVAAGVVSGPFQATVETSLTPSEMARWLLSPDSPIAQLSTTEREVFYWITRDLSNRQIAVQMHLSIRTIQGHVANIRAKLRLPRRGAILSFAQEQGLV